MEFWRLATSIQAFSSLLMAIFFVALARTSKSRALWLWSGAWLANLVALSIVSAYWGQLVPLVTVAGAGGYVFFKSAFVVLIALGVVALDDGRRSIRWVPTLAALVALAIVAGALSTRSFYLVSFIEGGVIIAGLTGAALHALRHPLPRVRWLAGFMLARALLAFLEFIGNLSLWRHWPAAAAVDMPVLMTASSSLDAIVEWAIGLAALLVFYELTQRRLLQANAALQATQQRMRELVTHDQLTGLLNRRALPAILQAARTAGASIVFFDIDHFKTVNDTRGHDVGDACLVRFAAALKASFRDDDHVLRYAGDEFIVIAPGLSGEGLHGRVEGVRTRLIARQLGTPAIPFSHGVVDLPAGGDPEAALREADRAMYANKARHSERDPASRVTPLRPAS